MFSKVLQLHAIKRGPLSLFRTSGIPCLEKIAMSLEIVDLAEVDVTISTSGKQLYLSMTTVRYSPQGSGLGKSIVSSFHGMFGNSVILRGSNRSALLIVAAWYGKQLSTFFTLAIFSIAGNQIICLMRRLVLQFLGTQRVLGSRLCLLVLLGLRSCFPSVQFLGRPTVHLSHFCTPVLRDASTGQSQWP